MVISGDIFVGIYLDGEVLRYDSASRLESLEHSCVEYRSQGFAIASLLLSTREGSELV